jgi:hypothetical protein
MHLDINKGEINKMEYNGGKSMKLGINYLSECMFPLKPLSQIRRDLERMKKYGFETVRVTGHDLSWMFKISKEAKKAGLKIWLCPRFAREPMLTREEYLQKMREFAMETKENIDVFLVGNELSLELRDFAEIQGYENRCGENWQRFENEFQQRKNIFREYLTSLVKEAKKHFSGPVSYAAGTWEVGVVDWREFDIVSANLYLWERFAESEYLETLENLKKYGKPVIVSEFGYTTTREAWEIGPRHIYGERKVPTMIRNFLMSHFGLVQNILKINPQILLKTKIPHHYDEYVQAKLLKKNLAILEEARVEMAFVFQWSEPLDAGFGLTGKNGTPKKALSLFYKTKP